MGSGSKTLAAIDAGSNGVRLLISRVDSPVEIYPVVNQRYPVRLGHNVFTTGTITDETAGRALIAFKRFGRLLARHRVEQYRAVATSATREASNRSELLGRLRDETGIELEVLPADEEANLINVAVLEAIDESFSPDLTLDLGGGSLEISVLDAGSVRHSVTLPIGTVRLMEQLSLSGALGPAEVDRLREHIQSILEKGLPRKPSLLDPLAVACGGNAEFLVDLARGRDRGTTSTLDIYLLEERLLEILRQSVPERMSHYGARRDRAEVMGIAAVVFATLGRWLRLRELMVPKVGLKEGILRDLIERHFGAVRTDALSRERTRLSAARRAAFHFGCELRHVEHVRLLALSLFEQLKQAHNLDGQSRHLLELGALLHDIGRFINRKKHHKHGQYLVMNTPIPGLDEQHRKIVACLVRFHNNETPQKKHRLFASLTTSERQAVRQLAGLLRLAEGLDADHLQQVVSVEARVEGGRVHFRLASDAGPFDMERLRNKTRTFQDEFGLSPVFEF